jgi:hypothetical protein
VRALMMVGVHPGDGGHRPVLGLGTLELSENIYKGRFIEVLDVAPLGPQAPVVPGLPKLPEAGQYYASPALADLMKSAPGDELGDRFPGAEVGTIGYQALSGPHEPVAIVGYPTALRGALTRVSGRRRGLSTAARGPLPSPQGQENADGTPDGDHAQVVPGPG